MAPHTHEPSSHADARKVLLARRAALTAVKKQNESDGAALREGDDGSRDRANSGGLAAMLATLADRERNELKELDAAISRLDDGTWGRCLQCGGAVGRARLAAIPEAMLCLACSGDQNARRP